LGDISRKDDLASSEHVVGNDERATTFAYIAPGEEGEGDGRGRRRRGRRGRPGIRLKQFFTCLQAPSMGSP
jgi:hypothetical protein